VRWLGRRTYVGEVAWDRFFVGGEPDSELGPGRM